MIRDEQSNRTFASGLDRGIELLYHVRWFLSPFGSVTIGSSFLPAAINLIISLCRMNRKLSIVDITAWIVKELEG